MSVECGECERARGHDKTCSRYVPPPKCLNPRCPDFGKERDSYIRDDCPASHYLEFNQLPKDQP